MKLEFCFLCGKKIGNGKGVGPVCGATVGNGPNDHRHKFAKTQFLKTKMAARGLGIMVGHDFEVREIFCMPLNHPTPASLEQELKIKALKKYFYQTVFYSLSGPEQRELVQHLYEDKDEEGAA